MFFAHLKSMLVPRNLVQTEADSDNSDGKGRVFKLVSKAIILGEVQQSIIATWKHKTFVEGRIIVNQNLCDNNMTKVKLKTWMYAAKHTTLNTETEVLIMAGITSAFARPRSLLPGHPERGGRSETSN